MTLPAPDAIGFDYGRTLARIVHPGGALVAAGQAVLTLLEVDSSHLPVPESDFGNRVEEEVDRLVDEAHKRDPRHEVQILDIYGQVLRGLLGETIRESQVELACEVLQGAWGGSVEADRGAVATLPLLRRQGLRLGMLSNAPYPAKTMRAMFERQGLAQSFDTIVLSSEVGWRKPSPEVFRALLSQLGVAASKCWFVGDEMEADLKGATAMGMTAIAAPGALAPGSYQPQLGTWEELPRLVEASRA